MALTMSRLSLITVLAMTAVAGADDTEEGEKGEKKYLSKKEYELHQEKEAKHEKLAKTPEYKAFMYHEVPKCPRPVNCSDGEKLAQKRGVKPWIYGCEVLRFLDKPEGANKAMRTCCAEREICIRTCGKTSTQCFENFIGCVQTVCGADTASKNDPVVAGCMGRVMNVTVAFGHTHDQKCLTYSHFQSEVCECVPEDKFKDHIEGWMIDFYGEHQPSKVEDGALKNSEMMWKKWGGKEPAMFIALLNKYKSAVERRPINYAEADYVQGLLATAVAEEEYEEAEILEARMGRINASFVVRDWFWYKHHSPDGTTYEDYREALENKGSHPLFKTFPWHKNRDYVDEHEEDKEEM